jgi:hypothetical protein
MQSNVGQEFRLNEFKILYKKWRVGTLWVDHLLFGLLKWLENLIIEHRVKTTVDQAIQEYEQQEVTEDLVSPVYSETGQSFFDEMRLTAPWHKK